MRLIDADVLKADYGMADDCKQCEQNVGKCQYEHIYTKMDFCGWIDDAETASISLLQAIETIERFYDSCERSTSTLKTPDGVERITDWGYFEEGLYELKQYAEGIIHESGES